MAQRAFRIDLVRPASPEQAGHAESRIVIGRDEPHSARHSFSRRGFIARSLIAVRNLPFALWLRARRFFSADQIMTAVLTAIIGGAFVYFWISFFSEALR